MSATREESGRSADVSGPSIGLLLTEPARGLAGFAAMPLAASWLSSAPRGDGHGVLVVPGLLASDVSTSVLRRFVRRLGYHAVGWNLGRNRGPTERVIDELPRELGALAERTGGPVSLIALTDARQSHAGRAYRRREHLHATNGVPTPEQVAEPIGVPSTAVFSRYDGIVAWRACIGPETELHENVEVRCAHLGFGTDPATLWVVADRLAAPASGRERFRPPAALRSHYPGR